MSENMGNKAYVLDDTDLFGCRVVFEKKNYETHRMKHRELEIEAFFPNRVEKALKKPTFTIQSKNPDTLCYYYEEYSRNGTVMYTKVVVFEKFRNRKRDPICVIKTAFRIDNVKELKYGFKPNYHNL